MYLSSTLKIILRAMLNLYKLFYLVADFWLWQYWFLYCCFLFLLPMANSAEKAGVRYYKGQMGMDDNGISFTCPDYMFLHYFRSEKSFLRSSLYLSGCHIIFTGHLFIPSRNQAEINRIRSFCVLMAIHI